MIRILIALTTMLLLVSCERGVTSQDGPYSLQTWEGKWEDRTGFWLSIEVDGDTLVFERSGEQPDSPTVFRVESFSEDLSEIRIIEKSDYAHYRHTLTLSSKNKLSRKMFDLEEKKLWGQDELTKR